MKRWLISRTIGIVALLVVLLCMCLFVLDAANAQSGPNPTTPGYVTCSNWRDPGRTDCPWQSASDFYIAGSIAATNGTVTIPLNNRATVGLSVTGTWTGALTMRASVDYAYVGAANATWVTTTAVPVSTGAPTTAISANGVFQVNASGFSALQVIGTSIASGTANIALVGSQGVSTIMADNPIPVVPSSQLPLASTPITASATGSTGAISATLAAATAKTTYICGFSYQGSDATAAVAANIAVTGTVSGTMNFGYVALAAGAAVPQPPPITQNFNPCVPSSAVNTAIVVTPPTLGAGATLATVSAWGYQQ